MAVLEADPQETESILSFVTLVDIDMDPGDRRFFQFEPKKLSSKFMWYGVTLETLCEGVSGSFSECALVERAGRARGMSFVEVRVGEQSMACMQCDEIPPGYRRERLAIGPIAIGPGEVVRAGVGVCRPLGPSVSPGPVVSYRLVLHGDVEGGL
jgi:hypothetical protein